jgi:Cu(I)/Ag(I) efflux system membrane fusion protein
MKTIWITILTLVISACTNKKQQVSDKNMPGMKMDTKEKRTSMENMAGMDSNVYYTCSMHPQVMESKPGKCPICGMKLIAIQKNNTPNAEELKLSDQQVQLGNIQTDTISSSMLGDETILTATLNIDQKKTTSISARVMGRIEKLYFKNTGDYVKEGARLYDLYSEDLNNAKQELILAIEQKKMLDNSIIDFNQLIQSAKFKLKLWGMTEEQIEELVKTKKTTPITAYYSNVSGYITTIELKEGDYTMEGSTIIKLADLSTVWAEAQVYSSQLSNIDVRGMAEVQIPGMPGRKMEGKIEFVNPEINPDTRINLVRLSILNPGNQLKPGMPAYVILNNRKHSTISLPIAAVIRDGISANVWLQTGTNTFKSKMVEVGMETGNRIEIKSGLKAGDIIVTSGAYLINSEYIFKNGASPMAGMKM